VFIAEDNERRGCSVPKILEKDYKIGKCGALTSALVTSMYLCLWEGEQWGLGYRIGKATASDPLVHLPLFLFQIP
jgi:hypothetical protein